MTQSEDMIFLHSSRNVYFVLSMLLTKINLTDKHTMIKKTTANGHQRTSKKLGDVLWLFYFFFSGLINWKRYHLKEFELIFIFNVFLKLVHKRKRTTKYTRLRACADICASACTYIFDQDVVRLYILKSGRLSESRFWV